MNKHVSKALVLILGLFALSCSRAAPPEPLPISSAVACTSNSDCTTNNEICDTIFNNGTDTGSGSCRQICNPNGTTACPQGDFCNPINGVCETACGSQSTNFCPTRFATKLGTGYSPTCIAGNYCAVQPNGTNCPPDFKPSGGFCRPSSASTCPGSLKPDLITETCEVSCTANKDCTILNYTSGSSANPVNFNFSCSPITSTCVPQCTSVPSLTAWSQGGCAGTIRKICYAPGNPQTGSLSGTCEKKCATTSECGTGKCVEGICQLSCPTSCSNSQVCDPLDQICRTKCTQTGSECGTGSGLVCSPITATCVPSCASASPNCVGNRNNCYAPGGAAGGACEIGCTTGTCAAETALCAEGICQQKCSAVGSCSGNSAWNSVKNTCDVISGVCRVGCISSSNCSSGLACSPITSTCVQQCTSPNTGCLAGDVRGQCYVPGAQPSGTSGSCEKPCVSSQCPTTTLPGFPKGLQCEEGICQQKCQTITVPTSPKTDNSDCSQNASGRTTCDYVSSVCRAGCSSTTLCPTGQGLSCSIVSGTCVATCTTLTSCPVNRNTCATATVSVYGSTCEMACTNKPNACLDPNGQLLCQQYASITNPASTNFCLINSSKTTGTNGVCPSGLPSDGYSCGYGNSSP